MGAEAVATKKVVIEVEVPEDLKLEGDVELFLKLLRKEAPLNVKQRDLRRTGIYASRTRYQHVHLYDGRWMIERVSLIVG